MNSCEKESISLTDETQVEVALKDIPLPPYREFVCGDPDPNSPYPCPNGSCPYLGWDCLFEVEVYAIPHAHYGEYTNAASILQGYINNGNVETFFTNENQAITYLMPELTPPLDAVGQALLNDLQNGTNSLRMHPVIDSQTDREYYLIQIYVTATGDSPDYSSLQ